MIGSGIAGLGAAHALRRAHHVEVFERDDRPGGHANTVEVARGDGSLLALDTGFLVHNRHNYPLLTRLFGDLRVATQDSDMSFGVSCARCRLEYSAVRLWAQPRVAVRPVMARLLAEIVRFLRTGRRALEERHARSTLDDYLRIEGYSRFFRDHFIVPFSAASKRWTASSSVRTVTPSASRRIVRTPARRWRRSPSGAVIRST